MKNRVDLRGFVSEQGWLAGLAVVLELVCLTMGGSMSALQAVGRS